MAHELEMINGVAQMVYVGSTPWHKLGQRVADNLTPKEMMQAAGVDWRVATLPTFAHLQVGSETTFLPTGMKALVRETDGRVLTQVGPNWNPVQNEEAFEFFDSFVKAGSMKMHTAGSLKNGEIVWALAKVDDDFELFNGDKVESYLLFSNPHQYGKSIDIRFTPTRVVCQNTLALSLEMNAKTSAKVNHRKVFNSDEVKQMLGIATTKMATYKEVATFLGSKQIKKPVMEQYFGELLGMSKKNEKELSTTAKLALATLETQPGAQFAAGTMWSAYNCTSYLIDHILGRSADTRLQSAWYGANRKLKVEALDLAVKYTEAA